jgi:hypothetical protein
VTGRWLPTFQRIFFCLHLQDGYTEGGGIRFPRNVWYVSLSLHGVTSCKIVMFLVTAVRDSYAMALYQLQRLFTRNLIPPDPEYQFVPSAVELNRNPSSSF